MTKTSTLLTRTTVNNWLSHYQITTSKHLSSCLEKHCTQSLIAQLRLLEGNFPLRSPPFGPLWVEYPSPTHNSWDGRTHKIVILSCSDITAVFILVQNPRQCVAQENIRATKSGREAWEGSCALLWCVGQACWQWHTAESCFQWCGQIILHQWPQIFLHPNDFHATSDISVGFREFFFLCYAIFGIWPTM